MAFSLTRVPVELWEKILGILIDEIGFLNPYLVNCENDAEIELFWRSERQYFEIEDQRRHLRRVCRSWKEYADRRKNRLVHIPDIAARVQSSDALLSAIRLQVAPLAKTCTCDVLCICVRRQRSKNLIEGRGRNYEAVYEQARKKVQAITVPFFSSVSSSRIRILTGATAAFNNWVFPFANLQALSLTLTLSKHAPEFQRLSKEFNRLLLLRLKVRRPSFAQTSPDHHGLVFPSLKSLDYFEASAVLPMYEHWILPQLQHLCISLTNSDRLTRQFLALLGRIGHNLKTLILLNPSMLNPFVLSHPTPLFDAAFWELVPNLTTFGADLSIPSLSTSTPSPTRPSLQRLIQTNHYNQPLFSPTPIFPSRVLDNFTTVRVVSFHRTWKDLRDIRTRRNSEPGLWHFLRSAQRECETRGVSLQDVEGVSMKESENGLFLLEPSK